RERGAAALFPVAGDAVEETHHPLDHRHVPPAGRLREYAAILFRRHHPGIERRRLDPGDGRMVSGIDEVGPRLERLHPEAALAEGREQRERDRRLPDAARAPPDEERVHVQEALIYSASHTWRLICTAAWRSSACRGRRAPGAAPRSSRRRTAPCRRRG